MDGIVWIGIFVGCYVLLMIGAYVWDVRLNSSQRWKIIIGVVVVLVASCSVVRFVLPGNDGVKNGEVVHGWVLQFPGDVYTVEKHHTQIYGFHEIGMYDDVGYFSISGIFTTVGAHDIDDKIVKIAYEVLNEDLKIKGWSAYDMWIMTAKGTPLGDAVNKKFRQRIKEAGITYEGTNTNPTIDVWPSYGKQRGFSDGYGGIHGPNDEYLMNGGTFDLPGFGG